jgi:RNA recognition motif-containing protein
MSQRLYVGNLSYSSTKDTVRDAFIQIGEVTDVHVALDRETGRSRGFAFVTMASPALAAQAVEQMDGAMVDGRALRVRVAEDRPRTGGGGGFGGGGGGGGFGGGGYGGGGERGGDRGGDRRGGGRRF